jgi:hypothetical protein
MLKESDNVELFNNTFKNNRFKNDIVGANHPEPVRDAYVNMLRNIYKTSQYLKGTSFYAHLFHITSTRLVN